MLRFFPLLSVTLAWSCATPADDPPPHPLPAAPRESPVVAFYRGEAVTWETVSRSMLERDRRRSVDLYLRWRVLDDEIRKLHVDATGEELRRRAEQIVREEESLIGTEPFLARLRERDLTRREYARLLTGSPLLKETLLREIVVRYSALREGWIRVDLWTFPARTEAEAFLADKEGKDLSPARGILARGAGAVNLSRTTVERLFSTPEGTWTPPLQTPGGEFLVAHVRESGLARAVSYAEARAEVFEWILRTPPTKAELVNWIEGRLKRSKIEYAHRNPSGN